MLRALEHRDHLLAGVIDGEALAVVVAAKCFWSRVTARYMGEITVAAPWLPDPMDAPASLVRDTAAW